MAAMPAVPCSVKEYQKAETRDSTLIFIAFQAFEKVFIGGKQAPLRILVKLL